MVWLGLQFGLGSSLLDGTVEVLNANSLPGKKEQIT